MPKGRPLSISLSFPRVAHSHLKPWFANCASYGNFSSRSCRAKPTHGASFISTPLVFSTKTFSPAQKPNLPPLVSSGFPLPQLIIQNLCHVASYLGKELHRKKAQQCNNSGNACTGVKWREKVQPVSVRERERDLP